MKNNEKAVKRLSGETYYFPGLTNSVLKDGILIDTGPEESIYEGFAIRQIVITHGHADHFSSAPFFRRNGAKIIAAREEVSLIENPEINIRGMFSWAKPSDELVTKLFRGEGCKVDIYLDEWHKPAVQTIPLPGHTLGHSGFLTEDGVLFTGDAMYLKELWKRHPLPYAIDPGLVISSLELIQSLDFEFLVPAHGEPVSKEDSELHIVHHLKRIDSIFNLIIDLLHEAKSTEEIIALVSKKLGLVENPAQYWLAVTTVKGYLANLLQSKKVEFFVSNHAGFWHAV